MHSIHMEFARGVITMSAKGEYFLMGVRHRGTRMYTTPIVFRIKLPKAGEKEITVTIEQALEIYGGLGECIAAALKEKYNYD